MQIGRVVVGVFLLLVSVVSYSWVFMSVAAATAQSGSSTAALAVPAGVAFRVTAAASPVISGGAIGMGSALTSISEPGVMLASGIVLIGLGAGLRRHTC